VTAGSAAGPGGGGRRPGPALAELHHEHEVILRALALLERAGDRLAAGRAVDEAALAGLVELLRTFADRCHHGKEESHLFPAARATDAAGLLPPFLEDHEEGRALLRALAGGGDPGRRAAAARRYVGLLRDHIRREDEVLFPLLDEALGPAVQAALARAFEEVEREVVGPGVHERLLATLADLEGRLPPEGAP
jgi:hemerythrin-like domain-containing protein